MLTLRKTRDIRLKLANLQRRGAISFWGTVFLIEVYDRRALDAVWRDGRLWMTMTINPESGPDSGETTAHWVQLDTTTVRASETVFAGQAPYKRYFGGTRNRWGDYSGVAVDPTNDDFVWVFNEYAAMPGLPTVGTFGPEDGRWGTVWARMKFVGNR